MKNYVLIDLGVALCVNYLGHSILVYLNLDPAMSNNKWPENTST